MLDTIFSVFLAAGQVLGITLFVEDEDIVLPPMHQVVAISMTTAAPVAIRVRPKSDEEKCRYSGVVVPYEQLWEERTTNAFGIDTVTPPQPGKIAAFGIIINRKDCDGKEPEAMFRVSTHYRTAFNGHLLRGGARYVSLQLSSIPEDSRPKWVSQVVETIATAADTNPIAKEFMRFTEESAKKMRMEQRTGAVQ